MKRLEEKKSYNIDWSDVETVPFGQKHLVFYVERV